MDRIPIILIILVILLLICVFFFGKTRYDLYRLDQFDQAFKQCQTVECMEKAADKWGQRDIIEEAKKNCEYCKPK